MQMTTGVFLALLCAIGIWLFARWRSPRPEFAPLATADDDPLMLAAFARAKESRPRFLSLARAPHQHALVKLRFVSSSGEIEHLWAEVLEVLGDAELGIRLVTPPVTHSGPVERLHRCGIDDIEDWQVRDADGRIHGGYSQRAMYAIARRDGVKLPKALLRHEAEYADI
jgi:uncharacterized protein YegJ (DUF2314 family)